MSALFAVFESAIALLGFISVHFPCTRLDINSNDLAFVIRDRWDNNPIGSRLLLLPPWYVGLFSALAQLSQSAHQKPRASESVVS